MSIELKVGEWYETRGGERVKVLADTGAHGIEPTGGGDNFMTITPKGTVRWYYQDGQYLTEIPDSRDIIKHIPGCTGWDWQEPKWRDAKPEDALRDPPLRCRVRDFMESSWQYHDGKAVLIGHLRAFPQEDTGWLPWRVYTQTVGGYRRGFWRYCQVLDQ